MSVLNQTFTHFEFLIVVDGYNSPAVIAFLRNSQKIDKRIRCFFNENIGLTKALNYAICNASGKYIVRQDGDDASDRNRLQTLYEFISKLDKTDSNIIVTSQTLFYDEVNKKFLGKIRAKKLTFWHHFKLRLCNQYSHGTFCFSRELKYDEKFRVSQDYELLIRAIFNLKFKHYHLDRVLYLNRVHNKQISKDRKSQLDACYRAQHKVFGISNVFMIILRVLVYYVLLWRTA